MTAIISGISPARSATPLHITLAPEAEYAAWQTYADGAAETTPFQLPAWTRLVARHFGHTPLPLLAWRGGRVVGVLPLMELRSFLAGRMLVSVPYATSAGPLVDGPDVAEVLLRAAGELCRQRGARCVDVRSRSAASPPDEHWQCDDRYLSFRRPLPLSVQECATYLPRKARAAARQAREREGLVATHTTEALDTVWRLYTRSMRRLGSLAYPLRFFRGLANTFGERCWITVVRDGERAVAGLLSLVHRDTLYPYFLGVDERDRRTGATNLIYLAVIERAVRAQLRTFDFGRTRRDNPGPAKFKQNQGFEPTTLGYQRYTPPGAAPLDLSPTNPRFALARRIWPKLPLAVVNPLGGWLARAIPG